MGDTLRERGPQQPRDAGGSTAPVSALKKFAPLDIFYLVSSVPPSLPLSRLLRSDRLFVFG